MSVYGLSKLAGEYQARARCPKHFVIRTCGLYGVWGSGGKGGNFVETMRRLGAQGKPVRVVDDQTCTPSYTVDIAAATADLIETGRYGLYHLTNAGSCTWCEFAKGIFDAAGIKCEIVPITSQQYGSVARRPSYSVLAGDTYESLGLAPLRRWQDALAAYMDERAKTGA